MKYLDELDELAKHLAFEHTCSVAGARAALVECQGDYDEAVELVRFAASASVSLDVVLTARRRLREAFRRRHTPIVFECKLSRKEP